MFSTDAFELADAIERHARKHGLDWKIDADADLETDEAGDVIDETWFVSVMGPKPSDYWRVYNEDEWKELLANTPEV